MQVVRYAPRAFCVCLGGIAFWGGCLLMEKKPLLGTLLKVVSLLLASKILEENEVGVFFSFTPTERLVFGAPTYKTEPISPKFSIPTPPGGIPSASETQPSYCLRDSHNPAWGLHWLPVEDYSHVVLPTPGRRSL